MRNPVGGIVTGMEHFFALTGGDPAVFAKAAEVVGMEVVGPPLRD